MSTFTEGFAFYAWHRLRWPNRTEHTDALLFPSCQKSIYGKWICRAIWERGEDR